MTSLTERIVDLNVSIISNEEVKSSRSDVKSLLQDPSTGTNPYGLGDGTKYYLLEVEDWTQPGSASAKRRKSSTVKPSSPETASSPPRERPISPPPADPVQPSGVTAAESLGATRSPNSHLFPVRTRSNSASAGPSSLSRLLAQANPDSQVETVVPPSIPTTASTTPFDGKSFVSGPAASTLADSATRTSAYALTERTITFTTRLSSQFVVAVIIQRKHNHYLWPLPALCLLATTRT